MRSRTAVVVVCLGLVPAAVGARPRRPAPVLVQPRIVNGAVSADIPSVGALLYGGDPDSAIPWCTGTMVGCETMLTARHCVTDQLPGDHLVFLPHAGFFSVASIAENPGSGPGTFGADLALVKLGAPITGIRPSALNTLGPVPDGTRGTIVGYGLAQDVPGIGLRRRGAVKTAPCPVVKDSPPYAQPAGALCFGFWAPFGPPGSNSGTCSGDSGGPLFVDLGSGPMVAGVTATGVNPGGKAVTCSPPQFGVDAPVDAHLGWLQTEGGADLTNVSCGAILQLGDVGTSTESFAGTVDAGQDESRHALDVSHGAAELRVTMNGTFLIEDNVNDFDLYVKHGGPPTTADFDCRRDGAGQFAACLFIDPAPGAWHVLVHRKSGAGAYQVSATTFTRDCSQPGVEGLPCADGNPCTTAETCQGGGCTGTAAPYATPCEDANQCTAPDTCQSGTCTGPALGDGTPCDDGDRCSRPDVCLAGAWAGTAPALGCVLPTVAGAGALALTDGSPDRKDKLTWKWSKGGATPLAALGDPVTTTDYALCAYDRSAGIPQRILELSLAAGAGWRASSSGVAYKNDRNLTLGGITGLTIRAGEAGKATITLKGKAHALGMPDLPLAKDPAVTVQLVNPLGCWETTFSSSTRNDDRQFKAKAD